ncbi:MAG: tyrosine-type recombinase/integrase [Thaumarchaeota archaeon]|nr:tyrosine-type recombinase/integrase [Nitrososphaerota archaeon]
MQSRSFTLFEAAIKSTQTKSVYTYSLHEFMKFAKISQYDNIVKLSTDKIQKLLENWVMDLASRNLKAATIRSKLSAVELFLEMNKKTFHKKILHKLIPSSDYIPGGEKPFTTQEIQQFLDSTTKLRTKALVHFFASTGVRPASITDPVLRLKHLEDMPHNCKSIRIYDGSKEGYWAFLTPEASTSLNQYLQSRKLNGEELTSESPIFAISNPSIHTTKNNYLSAKSVRHLMNNLIKTAGIERVKDGNRFDKAATYGFRKRFNTTLKLNNDVNSNIAEKLMAHKNGLDGNYLKPTREQCFAEFVKAITELTISDEARNKAKIADLEKEKSVLQKEVIPLASRLRRTDAKVERLLKAMSEINPEYGEILEIRKSGPY